MDGNGISLNCTHFVSSSILHPPSSLVVYHRYAINFRLFLSLLFSRNIVFLYVRDTPLSVVVRDERVMILLSLSNCVIFDEAVVL